MSIATLILWAVTAGFGGYLLRAVTAAKRAARPPLPDTRVVSVGKVDGQQVTASRRVVVTAPASPGGTRAPGTAGSAEPPPGGTGLVEQAMPHITHTQVTIGPDDHPLLEFCHPALGIVGLGLWFAYTFVPFAVFGWAAFAALVVAVGAGSAWLTVNVRAARARRAGPDGTTAGRDQRPPVPPRVVAAHGLAAATTVALAATSVLTLVRW